MARVCRSATGFCYYSVILDLEKPVFVIHSSLRVCWTAYPQQRASSLQPEEYKVDVNLNSSPGGFGIVVFRSTVINSESSFSSTTIRPITGRNLRRDLQRRNPKDQILSAAGVRISHFKKP